MSKSRKIRINIPRFSRNCRFYGIKSRADVNSSDVLGDLNARRDDIAGRDALNSQYARAIYHSRNSLRADKYTTKSVNHSAIDSRHTRGAHLCSIGLCKEIHTLTCRSMLYEKRYSLLVRLTIPRSSTVPSTSESLRYRSGSWRNLNRIVIIDYDTLSGSTNVSRAHGCTRLILVFYSLSFSR